MANAIKKVQNSVIQNTFLLKLRIFLTIYMDSEGHSIKKVFFGNKMFTLINISGLERRKRFRTCDFWRIWIFRFWRKLTILPNSSEYLLVLQVFKYLFFNFIWSWIFFRTHQSRHRTNTSRWEFIVTTVNLNIHVCTGLGFTAISSDTLSYQTIIFRRPRFSSSHKQVLSKH